MTQPAWADWRLDLDTQCRLGEGMVAAGSQGPQGRYISLVESYFIIDPMTTAGFEVLVGPGRFGLGLRGLFPHPLAGEVRLWPLTWAELDGGWAGLHGDVGWTVVRFPSEGPSRWEAWLVPNLGLFVGIPGLRVGEDLVTFQPRLTANIRAVVNPQQGWALTPFTLSIGAGLVTTF
jgi:hypothetical protein